MGREVPVGGRFYHVLPLVLLHVEGLHVVFREQLWLVKLVEVVCRSQVLTLLEEQTLNEGGSTARSGSLSSIPLSSMEGPQRPPLSKLSNRS